MRAQHVTRAVTRTAVQTLQPITQRRRPIILFQFTLKTTRGIVLFPVQETLPIARHIVLPFAARDGCEWKHTNYKITLLLCAIWLLYVGDRPGLVQ